MLKPQEIGYFTRFWNYFVFESHKIARYLVLNVSLEIFYSERGEFKLSFAPKIFDLGPSRAKIWLKMFGKMAEICNFRGTFTQIGP